MSKYIIKLHSKSISNTWWGQEWCKTINVYADYENRLSRGKTYLRQERVQDLTIEDNTITAKVKGKWSDYYNVTIKIRELPRSKSNIIIKKISELGSILKGSIPEDCRFLFSIGELGLFPTKDDLIYTCDCPDSCGGLIYGSNWNSAKEICEVDPNNAMLCKHVAAVLYSVGSILDKEPLIIFQLRGINVTKYISEEIVAQTNNLLVGLYQRKEEERVIDKSLISDVFGIDFDWNYNIDTACENKSCFINNDEPKLIEIEAMPTKKEQCEAKRVEFRQYGTNGVYIASYVTMKKASEALNIPITRISRAVKGRVETAGCFQWRKMLVSEPISNIEPISSVKPEVTKITIPICKMTDDWRIIQIYPTINGASRELNIDHSSLRAALKGKQKTAGGFRWKYYEDGDIVDASVIDYKPVNCGVMKKAVYKMDRNGQIINEYESIAAAARNNGISEKLISRVVNGRGGTAGGFYWKYKQ